MSNKYKILHVIVALIGFAITLNVQAKGGVKPPPPPILDTIPTNLQSELSINGSFLGAVALSGNSLATTCGYTSATGIATNAVCMYLRNGLVWTPQTKLLPTAMARIRLLAPSLNGNTLVIPTLDTLLNKTNVATFERNINSAWVRKATLLPSAGEVFNEAIVSGNTIAIYGTSPASPNPVVFIYVRTTTTTGVIWTRQVVIKPPVISANAFYYSFAFDGDTVVFAASSFYVNGGNVAYVFKRTGALWAQQAKLVPSDKGLTSFSFGESVAVSGDNIIIGAPRAYGLNPNGNIWCNDFITCSTHIVGEQWSGAAYVFHRTNATWKQEAKLERSPGNAEKNDYYGDFVSANGNSVAVHADGTIERAGSLWVYSRSATGSWSLVSSVNPENTYITFGTGIGSVGKYIALDGNTYAALGYHGINASFLLKTVPEQRLFVFIK